MVLLGVDLECSFYIVHTVFQHMRDTAHHSVVDGCLSEWLSFQFRRAINSAAR